MSEGLLDMLCEGDCECYNIVPVTREQFRERRNNNEAMLCPKCKPKYEHLGLSEIEALGGKDL